ncbi:MAG: bifunctional 2-C-methyl-D-erythritol 4-phosphate cytidylyltransferase/2-C-methyl-D-erythritol 2,4-cyclodiphosphate synthase [Campylobacteraceae bacterium 4484_166]|nr:MAG: bifunctional 2-C-methyl-D-erythritol 4-phosphate cytidylyltransferase/2-C-methyl-D-erythritol 2,4-cyclodiphosphate synthase [Campylobacteraceae bacterium 4484_166]
MKDISLVVLSAGDSNRFGKYPKKQWIRTGDDPLWLYVAKRLSKFYDFDKIVIVVCQDELKYSSNFTEKFSFVVGGNTRKDSVLNAIKTLKTKFVMVTDVARCCITKKVIDKIIENKQKADCITPVLDVTDTVTLDRNIINRDDVKLIQTPQLSKLSLLQKALMTKNSFTDDSSAIKAVEGSVYYTKGSSKSIKLTTKTDKKKLKCLKKPSKKTFIGFGYDIHQFEINKPMYLGGVKFDEDFGFKAHSDGDVLIHSLIDAILGSIGAGDIGEFFPDNDKKYKNISSVKLLEYIRDFAYGVGYEIINIDITIVAQKPKITPKKDIIKENLSNILNLKKRYINIKATTNEKMDSIGQNKAVCVYSVVSARFRK